MSSSKGNVIPVFASDKEWKKAVMSVVSDSKDLHEKKDPDSCNIVSLYKLFASDEELSSMKESYRRGGYGYGHAKLSLLEKIKESFSEPRERYQQLIHSPAEIIDILEAGSERARKIAKSRLEQLKSQIGFL